MRLINHVWFIVLLVMYALCVGTALVVYRPGYSAYAIVGILSGLIVCLVSPLIEYILGTKRSVASPGYICKETRFQLVDEQVAPFIKSIPYYFAYIACTLCWKYSWLGLIGAGLAAVLVGRAVSRWRKHN